MSLDFSLTFQINHMQFFPSMSGLICLTAILKMKSAQLIRMKTDAEKYIYRRKKSFDSNP